MAHAHPDSQQDDAVASSRSPAEDETNPEKAKRKRAERVSLEPETLAAFTDYIEKAEAKSAGSLSPDGPFLWCDSNAASLQAIREGHTVAQYWAGDEPTPVHKGLIHDWIGATFIPRATVQSVLAILQDYDRHAEIYKPQVISANILSCSNDVFLVHMRLLKKKFITVVLDTEHHVEYLRISPTRWQCRSHTVWISEVENAGKPSERAQLPDHGYGFLWRLASYWRLEEKDDGVFVECRAISLTRDVPAALRWVIGPMVKRLPRESLTMTLEATRKRVVGMLALPAAPD